MFDPARDEVRKLPFAARVALLALVTAAIMAALWPSVHVYTVGADDRACLAVVDGFDHNMTEPAVVPESAAPVEPALTGNTDAASLARWRKQFAVYEARPDVQAQNAYLDWREGAGACVPPARHRLIESAVALLAIFVVTSAALITTRVLRSRRPPLAHV